MGKHIVEGPFTAARDMVQSSSRQTFGQRGDLLRLLGKPSQDLVDRERCVVHESTHVAWKPAVRDVGLSIVPPDNDPPLEIR
jgi:hypothetical protein